MGRRRAWEVCKAGLQGYVRFQKRLDPRHLLDFKNHVSLLEVMEIVVYRNVMIVVTDSRGSGWMDLKS